MAKPQSVKNLEARHQDGVRSPAGRDLRDQRPSSDEGAAGKAPFVDGLQAGDSGERAAGGTGEAKVEAWAEETAKKQASWMGNTLEIATQNTPEAQPDGEAPQATEEQPDATGEAGTPPLGEDSATEVADAAAAEKAYRDAVLGLTFAKMPTDEIANLSVDTVIAMGGPLRAEQIRIGKLMQAKAEVQANGEATSAEESGSEKPSLQPLPLGDAFKGLSEELENLGADPEVLKGFETNLSKLITSAIAAGSEGAQPELGGGLQERELERMVLRNARADLTDTFEELADQNQWNAVKADVEELASSGVLSSFDSIHDAVQHAAFMRFGAASLKKIRAAKATQVARRRMPTPIDSGHVARPMEMGEWVDKMAALQVKGDRDMIERHKGLKPSRGVGRNT